MRWFELVFSNRPRLQHRRHAIFWITWWIYFAGSYFFTQQATDQSTPGKWIWVLLVKSMLILLCHALMVYVTIYLMFPGVVKKRSWFYVGGILVSAVAITIAWSYFCYALLFPQFDGLTHMTGIITKKLLLWTSIAAGLISSLKIVIAAVGIKLFKHWWQKQKESERLEKEKIAVELQLLKAQIHPDVLFSSLENLYEFAQNNPPKASELLLKLSEVLSYVLYECDQTLVPLRKELKMIKDYLSLQEIKMEASLEVSCNVKGDATGKMIAPLLLLPFLENGLYYCQHRQLEKNWLSLDIKIEKGELLFKLVNGKLFSQPTTPPADDGLSNVYKRLELLYPGKNELRIYSGPEVMMTQLKLKLNETEQEPILATTSSYGAN